MLTNTKFVFPLFLFSICLLFACRKTTQIDYSKFKGDFYGERYIKSPVPWTGLSNIKHYDQVIEILVEEDSLAILGYKFAVNSQSQTLFENRFSTLLFSNNYDSIHLYSYDTYTSTVDTFVATRNVGGVYQNVRASSSLDTATYRFSVYEKSYPVTYPGVRIDTQYTADLLVEIALLNNYIHVSIEGELYSTPFWSTFGYLKSVSVGMDVEVEDIYWESDSLFITSVDYLGNGSSGGVDSVQITYQGVKQ